MGVQVEGLDLWRGFIAPYINFFLFVVGGYFLFRKPLSNMLASKKNDYLLLMAQAEQAMKEASALKRELEEKLAGLKAELDSMKQQAQASAESEANQIIGRAERLADSLKQEAERVVEAEFNLAKRGMQEEIIIQATKAVHAKIINELNQEAQSQIVDVRLEALGEVKVGVH
jgi:F0F1-type ATP synthase membrane subunit b/b'